MARLVLVPLSVLALLAGLLMFAAAITSLAGGIMESGSDALVRSELRATLAGAAAVAACALPLGFLGAVSVWRAPLLLRAFVLAAALLMLLCPLPPFPGFRLVPWHLDQTLSVGASVARGAALTLLMFAFVLRNAPIGLRRSAEAAGAGPLRAWWDAMVRPMWHVAVAAFTVAFLNAVAVGPAAMCIGSHLDLADVWLAPASLLTLAAAAAALDVLFRKPGRAA